VDGVISQWRCRTLQHQGGEQGGKVLIQGICRGRCIPGFQQRLCGLAEPVLE
jgi:hypothetical protein